MRSLLLIDLIKKSALPCGRAVYLEGEGDGIDDGGRWAGCLLLECGDVLQSRQFGVLPGVIGLASAYDDFLIGAELDERDVCV